MSESLKSSIQQLHFDKRFTRELPGDPVRENYRRRVKNACYSFVQPTPVKKPALLAYSEDMLSQLGLHACSIENQDFVQTFAGNQLHKQMQPYAMCYGGHQFGNWAGQLGDGRAIVLGDVINQQGQRWSLQLKGAGPTPYSRTADGLAVLRSSLREFLCSEAMYHLGVPTTRALSLVLTGEKVVRDMFYDGHPEYEPGAVVCRVAPSFIRFGNFQILTAQGDIETLKKLVDYCITTDFPHLGEPSVETYIKWFDEICTTTADMIVHWQRVGFVHGVMNTDNMSILGLTIDYGPYGWLEDYDPDWTPNTTDAQGRRYRFGQQPQIAHWNLLQLAEAIYPLINQTEPLEAALLHYADYYRQKSLNMYAAKLGFEQSSKDIQQLHNALENVLRQVETDMTLFYRALSSLDLLKQGKFDNTDLELIFKSVWYLENQITDEYRLNLLGWLEQYRKLALQTGLKELERKQRMNSTNPKFVLRNYLAQQAIDGIAQGDDSILRDLMKAMKVPYEEQPEFDQYCKKRPEWARHRPGCSMLSCSS
jgi:serine/tyrosine/threonine adenylyltransferase